MNEAMVRNVEGAARLGTSQFQTPLWHLFCLFSSLVATAVLYFCNVVCGICNVLWGNFTLNWPTSCFERCRHNSLRRKIQESWLMSRSQESNYMLLIHFSVAEHTS